MKQIQKVQLVATWVISFLIFSMVVAAQTSKTISKFYLQSGAGGGSHEGSFGELGLQTIIKNKWSATLSYQAIDMKYKNIPADYKPGSGRYFLLGFPISYSNEIEPMNMNLFSLTAGRYFKLSKYTWITTEGGVSLVKGDKASFTPSPVRYENYGSYLLGGDYTSSNYKMTIENKTTVGGMLRADLNWALSPALGFGAGAFANLNSIQSSMGFQVKLMLGLMGVEKNQKQRINKNQHRANKKSK